MTLTQSRGQTRPGFTLIEIMVAVIIVGIIAAAVAPLVFNYIKQTRVTRTKSDLRSIDGAITMFNAGIGQFPSSLKDLIKAPLDEKIRKRWQESGGPFLKGNEVPEDAWNNPYVYRLTTGQEHPYELFSYGPNGAGSTEGRISVWDL